MLNDFMPIKKDLKATGVRGEFTIVPLADAHYGSKEFNQKKWDDAIKRIQDDPNCYAVLVGDMIDNGLKNSVTNVYEQTCMPSEQKRWLTGALEPIKDKILAACGGNHERRSKEFDDDPLYDVMLRLGIENVYRPRIAFLYIRIMYPNDERHHKSAYAIAVTHGSGGGMYVASGANKVANFASYLEGVNCIITGHTHKPITFPVSKLQFDTHDMVIRQKQFTVVTASSFLDYGGYAVEKMLPPAATTLTEIKLTYNGTEERNIRVTQ